MSDRARPLDTSVEADAVQLASYRAMTGQERTAVMYRLNQFARETAAAGVRSRHPEYRESEVQRALFRILHGDTLTRAVFAGQPLLDP